MDTTNRETCVGFQELKIARIKEQTDTLNGMEKRYYFRILSELIRSFLFQGLAFLLKKVYLWKNLQRISRQIKEGGLRTFDLVDCKGRNAFLTLGEKHNFLAHNSASYGAGAKKWHTTFSLQGFTFTLDQCYEFHKAYWNLFKAIKKWEAAQLTAWEKNSGWLLDGLGLPCCISGLYLRDVTNRIIQRTGHEVLMMYQKTVTDLFRERGIRHTPWCYDYHDQMIMEIDVSQLEEANELMGKEAFIRLNKLLQNGTTVVELKGSGGIVKNLADSKLGG